MKMFKIMLAVIVIVIMLIITVISFCFFKTKDKSENKLIAEIKYFDSKITSIINSLNNISNENYQISVTKINNNESSKESAPSKNSELNSSEKESKENSSNDDSGKQYNLQESGILNIEDSNLNWKSIKKEVEMIYTIIPTSTLDFYKANILQNDILDFNKEFDNLTISVKNENKEDSLKSLAKLYSFLPNFFKKISNDNIYETILETKSNVFNGYVLLESNNWQDISNNVKSAIEKYATILDDANTSNKEYEIDRGYIILNEIEQAVQLQDREVFLIKYKNLLKQIEYII